MELGPGSKNRQPSESGQPGPPRCAILILSRPEAHEGPTATTRFRTIQVCPKDFCHLRGRLSLQQTTARVVGRLDGHCWRRGPKRGRSPVLDIGRRDFITLLGGAAVAWPLAAQTQQASKVYRVGWFLTSAPLAEMAGPDPIIPVGRAFVRGLRALGYVEGQNLVLERWSAEGKFEQALPEAIRVAFLGTNEVWKSLAGQHVQAAARMLGVTLTLAEHAPNHYADAFALIIRNRPDALFVARHPANYASRQLIAEFAVEQRIPGIYPFRDNVLVGGLMSYAASVTDLHRRAAGIVDRILKGTKPSDIPIELPTKMELVVNLKAAKAIGLTIPETFLLRADAVIE
jgi:hypothetical protein